MVVGPAFAASSSFVALAQKFAAPVSRCATSRIFVSTPGARKIRSSSIVMGNVELLSPQKAHALKGEALPWKHVDVRTVGEYEQGHATESVNIPFLNATSSGMAPNPDFLDSIVSVAGPLGGKEAKLLISCASGKRSAAACAALENEGFTNLADVDGGYSAWAKDEALPVERTH